MLPAQPNQSLIDGLTVLQTLASAKSPLGSREMARTLGLEPTRVNRLLKTLAHLGIAQQTADRQYVPGVAMHVLAAQAMFGSGLIRRAIGPLESLRHFNMSVAMGVLWRDQVAYLYHAGQGMSAAEAIGRVGLFPATRSAIGMALLARRSDAEIKTLFADRDIEHFPSIAALLKELASIRKAGAALIKPFDDKPIQSLAVAIPNESAAIAISGGMDRWQAAIFKSALRDAAEQIAGTKLNKTANNGTPVRQSST
jgi:DNA-binding IclR family transcriptional regulator